MDDRLYADDLLFGVASKFRTTKNKCECEIFALIWLRWNLGCLTKANLRIGSEGAVKIAFDDENGYIIVEVITAKICRGVIDTGHEIIRRQR